jgi:maltose alpha-D-glucosyltransferase/alpha-amylase
MQWSDEPHGGFTVSSKPVLPVISGGAYGFEHLNVAAQRRDPNSMLNWLERVCRMRKEVPEVGWGDFKMLPSREPAVLMLLYEWRNNAVFFIHNLAGEPHELSINANLPGKDGADLVNLLAENHSRSSATGQHHILLEPYEYRWYRVGVSTTSSNAAKSDHRPLFPLNWNSVAGSLRDDPDTRRFH